MDFWTVLLKSVDLSVIVLMVMSVTIMAIVWSWHRDDSGFSLQQALVDNATGKLAIEKVGYMVALSVTTWLMISIQLEHRMTPELILIYLGAFVTARLGAQGISVYKDVNSTPPKQP